MTFEVHTLNDTTIRQRRIIDMESIALRSAACCVCCTFGRSVGLVRSVRCVFVGVLSSPKKRLSSEHESWLSTTDFRKYTLLFCVYLIMLLLLPDSQPASQLAS